MNFNLVFYFILFNLLLSLIYSVGIQMSIKNIRNVFNQCMNESMCQECSEEGHYKLCRNYCYCCNLDEQCKAQN